jgi:sterol desaturase/sphingolipid hydroxylase (fatty acid hydroxylase superfamily)
MHDPFSTARMLTEALAIGLTALVFLEIGWDRLTRNPHRDGWETAMNLVTSLPNFAATLVVGAVVLPAVGELLAPLRLLALGPTPLGWLLAFIVTDLCYYAGHRLEHRVRALWAHHSVHHSSPGFDLSTALRIAWHDPFLTWVYLVPALLLGFPAEQALLALELGLLYQTWLHTRRIGRLPRWFEAILNTPSHHRVHHGQDRAFHDRNFGGVLIVWDRLFGTFAAESGEIRMGVAALPPSRNPWTVNWAETARLWQDLRARRGLDRIRTLVRPPDWSPPLSPPAP